jgi:YidC/Oxa1 family membrane protein insertase
MLDPIYEIFGTVLAFFYDLVPNLGVAIILLTFAIMLLLYPLTAKQAKSMMAMQRVQPEVKKLQAKYKGDRQKLNEEMMKFYQENKINPLAGCLPLLVQLPIFFSLFQVLRDSYKYVPKSSELYTALCGGFGTKTPNGTWTQCGADLTAGMKEAKPVLYAGIGVGDQIIHHLKFLGMDLQKSAVDAHDGLLSAAPYFILVGLVILTGFLQTRQAQKRTPVANKQMGMVMRILPIFFGLISLQFPAGLVLYFFVSNLWRLGQQEVIFRRHGSATSVGTKAAAIDVASKDRQKAKAATAVAELDAPEDADADTDTDTDAPSPPPAPKAKGPTSKSGPRPSGGTPATTQAQPKKTGGLRGLFALPPPPEGNGGATAAPSAPRPSTGGSGSPSGRPPQRRRKNKKKRKR